MSFVTHFATDISFDGRWLKVACGAEDFDSETPFSPDATADINMVSCSVCQKQLLTESIERRW